MTTDTGYESHERDSEAATTRAYFVIRDAISRGLDMKHDRLKKRRLEARECRACFYTRRISGQAISGYKCKYCEVCGEHGNTSVPKLCQRCSEAHNRCRRCEADIEVGGAL